MGCLVVGFVVVVVVVVVVQLPTRDRLSWRFFNGMPYLWRCNQNS